MTIELHDSVNSDGLFDVQSKAFAALEALFTAIGTTIPNSVETFLAQFLLRSDADDLDISAAMERLPAAIASWQGAASPLSNQIRTNLQNFLLELVSADASQPESTLTYALQYIIDQMLADGDYVAGNTISLTLTPGGTTVGDPAICYSHLRGDGLAQQNILAESIAITVSSAAGPTLRFRSPVAQPNKLAWDWPKGSGINTTITATDPASSLLPNGDFEDATIDDTPDGWIIHAGTPGTTVKITDIEVQTVAIGGTPTGGSYSLLWTNAASVVRSAGPFAHDASASTIQAALRLIPELSAVTVTSTGTSPNYTHTVTFYGVAGAIAQLTSVNDLTGGTPPITHATGTASNAGSYRGRALEYDSDGSQMTALYCPLTLSTDTVYFVHLRVRRTGAAAAGEVKVEITDGIGGTVIQDEAGNSAVLTIDVTAVSTTEHDSEWFSFRIPPGPTMPVYLRLRISTAISNTASVFFDDVTLVQGTRLYAGGPYVAVIAGGTPSHPDDTWTLAVANNRAGVIQEWWNRVFETAAKDLLLPVSGTSLIPPSWT